MATGTLAGRIVPHCRHSLELDDSLSMKGLALIWEKNQRFKKK